LTSRSTRWTASASRLGTSRVSKLRSLMRRLSSASARGRRGPWVRKLDSQLIAWVHKHDLPANARVPSGDELVYATPFRASTASPSAGRQHAVHDQRWASFWTRQGQSEPVGQPLS